MNAKNFVQSDILTPYAGDNGRIFADESELLYAPLEWQKRGLQETATGYGAKLTSPYKIRFEGKLRRLYVTVFSNAGSTWFILKGKKIFVD